MNDAQRNKAAAIEIIRRRYEQQRQQVEAIEPRMAEYYDHICEHSGTEKGDPNDLHNIYEILGAIRLLRLLRTYDIDRERVAQVIFDFEGEWEPDGKRWRHIRSGVKQPGRQHPVVYRVEPFQIFALVAIYGPVAWIDTENDIDTRDLLPTERENTDTGHIEDLRRLCTRFILFGPRKINKSGFGGFVNTEDFMRGDYDAQIFCTANSQDQSKILYKKTQDMLRSFDPKEQRIRFTATETNWKEGQFRAAQMKALPAGGKMPDGWFASTVDADEYGSAAYINGESDMGKTVATAESSMGPRREPLTIITTTASLISTGPFIELLEATHKMLMLEIKYDTGEAIPTQAEDRQMMLLLEPDEWERDEDYLLTSKIIRRKINPMLGKIAQHSFYDDEVAKSRMDDTKKRETIAKLFNIYNASRVTRWLTSDQIRTRQTDRRITDCRFADGWNVFAGLDFGGTDDFWAHAYLAVNYRNPTSPVGRFFADCAAWITAAALEKSPNRPLYEKWIEQGWLRVCHGEVMEPDLAINEMMTLNRQGINLVAFGYDPAQSKQPVNTIKAWLQSLDIDAQTIKQMVVPVPQTFMTHNGLIAEIEYMLLNQEPWLYLSPSPLWPWMFGNTMVEETSASLRKVVKQSANAKVDCIHALLDALYCFDLSEGQIQV